jgi:putative oxidoreductase
MATHIAAGSAVRSPSRDRAAVAATVARIVLGVVFTLSGFSGFAFLFMSPPPPPPGLAAEFTDVFFRTHWVQFVDGVELIAGVLLLANRYVTLAIVLLGAIFANILVFHITLQPTTIAVPLALVALWAFLAYRNRANLAVLLK